MDLNVISNDNYNSVSSEYSDEYSDKYSSDI